MEAYSSQKFTTYNILTDRRTLSRERRKAFMFDANKLFVLYLFYLEKCIYFFNSQILHTLITHHFSIIYQLISHEKVFPVQIK